MRVDKLVTNTDGEDVQVEIVFATGRPQHDVGIVEPWAQITSVEDRSGKQVSLHQDYVEAIECRLASEYA